jgi:hydrogenase maturation protein HypF
VAPELPLSEPARRRIQVRGLVQGVGFRPFVHRLAQDHGLAGWVRNGPEGVTIEIEGPPAALARFLADLPGRAPALSSITAIEATAIPVAGEAVFRVTHSEETGTPSTLPPPDLATCAACLAEVHDPLDRRFGYPFLNCTDCGPRYTILAGLPYDRERTAMRGFPLCAACRAEYDDFTDRRYHAEPIACPECGPQAWLLDPRGERIDAADGIAEAARRLAGGAIVAVKGLGGFHLACSPLDADAVARLRERKGRQEKPLAVMARDLATATSFARIGPPEEALLVHWSRPIVLLDPRETPGRHDLRIAPGVSGPTRKIGVMLAYTPLHRLLLDHPLPCLVMTSGNRSDEPIARDNDEALARLGGIADAFLVHDRPVLNRVDDSVVRPAGSRRILIRRSRGFVPQPIALPPLAGRPAPCVLAVGGDLKAACCLVVRGEAFPGPHVGDLEHPQAAAFLLESMETMVRLLGATPEAIVHDLHPDYVGTALATEFAARHGLRHLAVQHHHAHGLACLAENRWSGPAIVVALDGTGYGTDGTTWGGEVLVVDGTSATRVAGLRSRPLPGGDRAALEPWRMALSVLEGGTPGAPAETSPDPTAARTASGSPRYLEGVDPVLLDGARRMLRSPTCPRTSSAGRLFDAATAILGVRRVANFDGQAAMELEELASASADRAAYPHLTSGTPLEIDLGPALAAMHAETGVAITDRARRFHTTMVAALEETCLRVRAATGIETVALSGGVFQNAIILEELASALAARGIRVLTHDRVPPNDGGLALGQAWYGLLACADRLSESA